MLGWSWTIGGTFGFEFVNKDFFGGGWILHLFLIKVMYFNMTVENDSE